MPGHDRNLVRAGAFASARFLFAACVLLAAGTTCALSEAPKLSLPLDCTLGKDCYIQNFVDTDPGPGHADFTCAQLTYDGHKGTDFALPTRADMTRGVIVRAAAAGRVTALRDGMEDGTYLVDPASIAGRECGNGVLIDHGDGWETQYCHMQKGSIAVAQGQEINAGDRLGLVGLSGRSEFPHLHLSVRHQGQVVDPFNPNSTATCTQTPGSTLWRDPPAYVAGGVIAAGFADRVPAYDTIKAGTAAMPTLPPEASGMVLWGLAFGGQAGDMMVIEIDGPDGFRHSQIMEVDKEAALFFRASGKQRIGKPWPEGTYRGYVSLFRGTRTISQHSATLEIRH